MKILIVDDHATNLRLLRAQLESEGQIILEAADGVEALKVLSAETVDAVISDALMPNMDGFRLCLEIRRSDRFGSLPFIIYTSTYNSPTDRKLALDVGADLYVVKPAPVAVLLEALTKACAGAANRHSGTFQPPEEMGVIKQYNAALVAKLEEKNAELQRANAELRASEARFHGTLDNMLEGCQIIGRDWRYLYLNDMAAAHGQRKKEELIGQSLLESYPGFEKTEMFAIMQRCMNERIGTRVENEFTHPNGSTAWFELSIQPVPEGIFILSLDISERKQAAAKIHEQLDELLRWQEVMLDREERVQALKAEVNELLRHQNLRPRYSDPIAP